MKVDLELVERVLRESGVTSADNIAKKIAEAAEAVKVPRASRPRKSFVLLVSDPEGVVPAGTELTGWALQIEDDASVNDLLPSMTSAGAEFNDTPKGRKCPCATVGDLMDTAPAQLLGEYGIFRKHKEPVFVVFTDNVLAKTV